MNNYARLTKERHYPKNILIFPIAMKSKRSNNKLSCIYFKIPTQYGKWIRVLIVIQEMLYCRFHSTHERKDIFKINMGF